MLSAPGSPHPLSEGLIPLFGASGSSGSLSIVSGAKGRTTNPQPLLCCQREGMEMGSRPRGRTTYGSDFLYGKR